MNISVIQKQVRIKTINKQFVQEKNQKLNNQLDFVRMVILFM